MSLKVKWLQHLASGFERTKESLDSSTNHRSYEGWIGGDRTAERSFIHFGPDQRHELIGRARAIIKL
jgi:hypothetical protein